MKLVGISCKTHEISQHSLGDRTWFLHHVLPAFEHVLCILSLETYAGHQNNKFFCQRINKNGSFVQFKFLYRVGTATYHWPRWDNVDRVHLSNIFSASVTVPHFISGRFEIPEQLAVETSLKSNRKHKRVYKLLEMTNSYCSSERQNLFDCWNFRIVYNPLESCCLCQNVC